MVSFTACVPRSKKSFPAKLSNEISFNKNSILTCTSKAPYFRSTCRGIRLRDTFTASSVIKQILRRYGQPSEFSEFPWHILRHIFLPQDRKKRIKERTKSFYPPMADHSRRFLSATAPRGISAFSFR